MTQCLQVRTDRVADMDVITNTGAVGGRIVGAEDFELAPQSQCSLGGDFDQMRGGFARLPGASLRIGAGDIEIA